LAEDYSGMTTNERLFAVGLMDAYDAAAARNDWGRVNEILGKVGLWRDDHGMIRSVVDEGYVG
jgi:hypothetical protein